MRNLTRAETSQALRQIEEAEAILFLIQKWTEPTADNEGDCILNSSLAVLGDCINAVYLTLRGKQGGDNGEV
ncbi:hypothetical protein B0187_04785 [Haemophilus paracuniculus]|uniref:Uncharacterized protein n=1 Tax=Haemophilus paracuniculus TaxID=734 RepID=A0A1T0ASF7_9PAST|nr:hypothetical protein [Haemophilus paracuniculus]OOR99411.1 hypothetical protein B0187_04785 [Haemophilus paracuniculus]